MVEGNFRKMKAPINSVLFVVQDNEYRWGVINKAGVIIVPFGKYAWIDGFQNGLAKVIGFKDNTSPNLEGMFDDNWNFIESKDLPKYSEQGIINEDGEEVLPLEYTVWKFYGKDYPTIKYFKGNKGFSVSFESLNTNLRNRNYGYLNTDDEDSYDEEYVSNDYMLDTWDAMTDGMYGDMPEEFNGDFDFLGY